VIPAKPFDVSQVQKAQAEASISQVMVQPDQPVGDLGILADAEHPASQSNTDAPLIDGFLRHLTSSRRLHQFFDGFLEDVMSAFNCSSVYIFLSRRFSSSSSFSRAIMDASIPLNLARHF